jgi:hypothetical protein
MRRRDDASVQEPVGPHGRTATGLSDEDLAGAAVAHALAEGRLGDHAAVLIFRIMGRMHAHPALAQSCEGDDAVFACSGDFIVKKGSDVLATFAAQHLSPGGAVGLLVTLVTRFLNDEWRKHPFGSVSHRLKQLLREESEFALVADATWYLAGQAAGEWDGSLENLVNAAATVDAPIPVWSKETGLPPLASRPDLVSVLVAVFQRAGGPLTVATLTRVCLTRFPHADGGTTVPFDERIDRPRGEVPFEDVVVAAVDEAAELAEAQAIVTTLDDGDIFILQNLASLERIGQYFGVGRTQASERRLKLKERLRAQVNECSDPRAVERQLPHAFVLVTGKVMAL